MSSENSLHHIQPGMDPTNNKTSGCVLIVDDDQTLCKAYKRILEKRDFKVHLAHTLQEADKLLSFWKFDVILSDIILGAEDGLLILQKNLNHRPETPVIVMTAEPSLQTATHALRLNAYDYLQKPISSQQLVNAVSRAVELCNLRTEKKRVELENQYYQKNLERMVENKTAKLIESNERYELLFLNSKDAIYVAKPNGTFININPAVTDLCNRDSQEMMQTKVRDLFETPDEYRRFEKEMQQNEYVKDFEFKLRKKEGEIIECLLTANLIRDPSEKIIGHQGIIRDITLQKKAERKIRDQNKFLKSILESLTHPFMVINPADYTIKIANSAALKSKLVADNTCHRLRHGIDHPCHQDGLSCSVKEVIKKGKPYHTEHIQCNLEGEQRKFEVHAFPLFGEEGDIVHVIQYFIDITEKKRLETIAEAANLMDNLGYIFSGIRHEIGNPLNSVKMALSVLSMNLDNYDKKTIEEFIRRSLSELSRVEYLLKALKNFSLFESPVVENVHLDQFMTNFLNLIQDDFQKKGIQITLTIAPSAKWVRVDHRALHQILLNLMTNSADATIDSKKPIIDISISKESEWIQIEVNDNGRGMLHEDMQNLFKPFFTSKAHGTGLGLVIVKKMVTKMDGSIRIDSTREKGTTVTLSFPEGTSSDLSPQKGESVDDQNVVGD